MNFFTPQANSAILPDWAHDVAIVIRDVLNRIRESSHPRRPHGSSLKPPLDS